jgi:hypothetical protein
MSWKSSTNICISFLAQKTLAISMTNGIWNSFPVWMLPCWSIKLNAISKSLLDPQCWQLISFSCNLLLTQVIASMIFVVRLLLNWTFHLGSGEAQGIIRSYWGCTSSSSWLSNAAVGKYHNRSYHHLHFWRSSSASRKSKIKIWQVTNQDGEQATTWTCK